MIMTGSNLRVLRFEEGSGEGLRLGSILFQEGHHGLRLLGHHVLALVMGEAWLAVQRGLLPPQLEDLLRNGLVGPSRVQLATLSPRPPSFLPEVSPVSKGEEGLYQGPR